MNCYYCGSKLADDENVCKRCGKEVKDIIIDCDKLRFDKESQNQDAFKANNGKKEASNISKDTEEIFNSIISDIQTDNINDPPDIEQKTKKETEKAPVEDVNKNSKAKIVESHEDFAVDSDKTAPPKGKKPIKVVVKTRKKR